MPNKGIRSISDVRKKLTYTHDLISTAYHEAGHAVYGLLHFMKIPLVYVYENKKNKRIEGLCHYEYLMSLSDIKDTQLRIKMIKTEICFKYAGLTSEKNYYKSISGSDAFPMLLRDGSSDDTLSAAALIKLYDMAPPGKKRYNLKKKLIKHTLRDLQENWDVVIMIAHHLFKKKKINFSQLKDLIIENDSRNFWKTHFEIIDSLYDNINSLSEKTIKSII